MSEDWANFFVAQVGASAALLGLLFVGVSLNLPRILASPQLPPRALLALLLLMVVLITSMIVLIPRLSSPLLGGLLLAMGLGLFVVGNRIEYRISRARETAINKFLISVALFEVACIPFLVAGGLMILGEMAGAYWLAVGMILATLKAASDAWVLLVEINR